MTHIQNSAFKVKASTVPDVSKILPEPGAFTISEHDGRAYYADKYGWHQSGTPYSPIQLFVVFDGVTQFNFKFKAPITSTLSINDGDGTITSVAGNDADIVTHTTNYTEAGTYFFWVGGDWVDMTFINIQNQFERVTGSIDGWGVLINLVQISVNSTEMYGDISVINEIVAMEKINTHYSNVSGSVDKLKDLINLTTFSVEFCSELTGDMSLLAATLTSLLYVYGQGTKIKHNTIVTWPAGVAQFHLTDCNLTGKMVDNALKSFVGSTGITIGLGGNNAPRTPDSDAAFAIVDANNTLTVNS